MKSIRIGIVLVACAASAWVACSSDGASSSSTEAGPPDRITAFGFISRKAASAFWNGTISE